MLDFLLGVPGFVVGIYENELSPENESGFKDVHCGLGSPCPLMRMLTEGRCGVSLTPENVCMPRIVLLHGIRYQVLAGTICDENLAVRIVLAKLVEVNCLRLPLLPNLYSLQ